MCLPLSGMRIQIGRCVCIHVVPSLLLDDGSVAMVDNHEIISEYLAKVTYFDSLGISGKEKGTWSVWVTGNWRVTFEFDGPNAVAVDYRDHH
jgi:hypothetical protein